MTRGQHLFGRSFLLESVQGSRSLRRPKEEQDASPALCELQGR